MEIKDNKTAYRIGFASAFILNSSEITERSKFSFSEVGVRYMKEMYDSFHKGYIECCELIKSVNLDFLVVNIDELSNIKLLECKSQLRNRGYIINY